MGVIYRVTDEIEKFVLDYKKENPHVSCRKLTDVVKDRFETVVSKSSINTIIKNAGLSDKIGRKPAIALPQENKEVTAVIQNAPASKQIQPIPTTVPSLPAQPTFKKPLGFFMLQAADAALGGLQFINAMLRPQADSQELYDQLADTVFSFTQTLQNISLPPNTDAANIQLIYRSLPARLQETYWYKITLSDDSEFLLDTEFRSIWQKRNIPREFSVSLETAKTRMNECLARGMLIILQAPNDLHLVNSVFSMAKNPVKKIELYGEANRLVHTFTIATSGPIHAIIGFTPGQFERNIVAITAKEPRSLLRNNKETFTISESEIEFTGPVDNRGQNIRLISIKNNGSPHPSIILCTNAGPLNSLRAAESFLDKWPDPAFALIDAEQKNELLLYGIERQFFFYPELSSAQFSAILEFWRHCLELYIIRHFLPLGYEKLDYAPIEQRLYGIEAEAQASDGRYTIRISLPQHYGFANDILYALKRMHENGIVDASGRRMWFEII